MENLIKVTTNEKGEGAVSARELHAFLESKRDFSNWIKDRIEKYGLVENQDFTSFNEIVEREIGATRRIEYALTIDCAKELSMVEGNEKGKQARRYFIACEKKLKQHIDATSTIEDPEIAAMMLTLRELDTVKKAQKKLALEQARQAERLDGVENRVADLGAKVQPDNDYFTVMGWGKRLGLSLPNNLAVKLGKRCAKLSRERGLHIGRVSDTRNGWVNSLHESVLNEVFDEFLSDEPLM